MLFFCSLGIYFIKLFRDFFAALAKLSDVKIILPSLHWNSENFLLNGQILYFSAQWADTLLCYLFAPWAFTLLRILPFTAFVTHVKNHLFNEEILNISH